MIKNAFTFRFLIISTFFVNGVFGQGDGLGDFKFRINSMLQNRMTTPGAPEASSLGKYGDYKVNTYTGLPSISIPIYSVQGSELSMSFNLNYEGGGIKVEQLPTWVGSGWNLNGGGVITRSVKGDPDMKVNYFNFNTLLNQNSNVPYSNDFTEKDFLLQAATKEVETQPDIFYFNAGGHSGKFYIKADQTIVMAESKDLLITPYFNSTNGNVDSFYVKDAMGVTYIFNIPESTTMSWSPDFGPLARVNTNFTFNSSWYLSKVINANATESIEIKYITEGTAYNPYLYINHNNYKSISYHHGFLSAGSGCTDPTCPYGDFPVVYDGSPTATLIANRRFLDEVVFKKGTNSVEKIKFSSSINPYVGGGRKLDTVSLYKGPNAASRLLNQIFTYTNGTKRLTLTKIQEVVPGGISKEPYSFSYSSTLLPDSLISNALDHWGYFNNQLSNANLIPAITCAGINANANFPNCSGMNNPATGANRNVDTIYAQAGTLTRITYPTKGYTDFVWESNRAITGDLICGDSPMERVVGGLRIKQINNYSFDGTALMTSRSYVYKFANGVCSGLLFYSPHYYTSSTFTTYAYPLSMLCSTSSTSGTRYTYTFNSSSITPLGSIQGGLVGYSRVEEVFTGKTVYNYKNYTPGFVAWGLSQDQDIQDLGQLLLVEEFNDIGQKIHSMGYKYSFDVAEARRSKIFYGLVVDPEDQQDNKTVRCLQGGTYSWQLNGDNSYSCTQSKIYPSKFVRRHYYITQDWIFNKETSDTIFYYNGLTPAGNVSKVVTNTFGNDSVSLPTLINMVNSDGRSYQKLIRYPHDIAASSMKTNLLNYRMYSVPIETENSVTGTLTYRTRTDYNTFNTSGLQGAGAWLLPQKYYEQYSGGSDILRETVDRYDASGTQVQEAHKEYDQPVTMLYSNSNTLTAAKVINAPFTKCAFTGFETNDVSQGGWSISTITNIAPDVDSKTGFGKYTGAGTISHGGLAVGNYIVSYWISGQAAPLSVTTVPSSTVTSSISSADPSGWQFVQHKVSISAAGGSVTINGAAAASIDELRLHPANALMTSYSYNRNTRLLSGTSNENSLPTKFEYDGLLRLTGVRNFNNAFQKIIDYNYKISAGTYNYVKSSEVLIDATTTVAAVNALAGSNIKRMFDYVDDIGRPLQSIGVAQSPLAKDMIVPHTYDAFGREASRYLPYADQTNAANGAYRTAATTDQSTFFNTQFSGEGNYAKQTITYENSPLNRVISEAPQGSAFSTHPISYAYTTNAASEVRDFTISNGSYPVNTLHKVTKTDENGNTIITYTDKLGLKVMESVSGAQTYFLYDGLQNIIQVIQPETVSQNPSGVSTVTSVQNGSFLYSYDYLNRLATKKIPGTSGMHRYTYDRLDREVLHTDPNGNQLFTKYDILNRVVMTGRYNGSIAIANTEPLYETTSTTLPYYTTTSAYPTANTDVYTINYYDDYNFDDVNADEVAYTTPTGGSISYATTNYLFVLGKLTGTRTAILKLDGSTPTAYIEDYPFYDIFGREIHHRSVHQLGGTDLSWMLYDFPGRLKNSRLQHNSSITSTIINQEYTYDHASRLTNTYHQIGDVATDKKLISVQVYNERDELSSKALGNGLQSIDFSYNIRKWLTKINDPAISNTDLFSQRLYYDAPPSTSPSTFTASPQYNGNISFSEWRTGANWTINGATRNLSGYTYAYDGLNRLTSSKYSEYLGSYGSTLADRYTVNNITYDKNGNIKSLSRNGLITAGNYGSIDNLTYSYDPNKINQLSTISDASNSTQGFRSGSSGTTYTYDSNGNMTTDASKNITSITYNHLNLPRTFTFSSGNTIEVTYDASGMKLSKVVKQGSNQVSRMDYVKGGIEYHNSKLQAIYHAEGRVAFTDATQSLSITAPINGETKSFKAGTIIADNTNTGSANVTMQASTNIQFLPGFFVEQGTAFNANIVSAAATSKAYEYVIRDHLGNGRIYFTDYNGNGSIEESNGEILQEAQYDPWGYALGGNWVNNPGVDNLYQYGNKEFNNDLGLSLSDFGSRWFDANIGRWTSVDPMFESRHSLTPFNYVQNNPILRVDPDGAFDDYFTTSGQFLGSDNIGNNIRIVNQYSEESVKNTLDNIFVQSKESIANLRATTSNVKDFNGGLSDDVQSNIATHYYENLGYDRNELKGRKFGVSNDDIKTGYENSKFDIKLPSNVIGRGLQNADDVRNMIVHERGGHGADYLEGKVYNYPNSYWSWEKSAVRLQTIHSSWAGTSEVFRNNIYFEYGHSSYVFSKKEQAKYFPAQLNNKKLFK